jgi:RIO kinase 1
MKIDMQFLDDLYWEDDDSKNIPQIKGVSRQQGKQDKHNPHKKRKSEIEAQADNLREYDFTYKASRHESGWLLNSLGPFYDEQWFDDVLRIVKGGKEASVYLCRANPSAPTDLIAAKVYRPRALRNLRKDHIYREGRAQLDADGLEIVDERMARAIQLGTEFGQEIMHRSWIEHEFRTMKKLSQAGCDIPAPYASAHNAILMDFIGDEMMAAPTLNGIDLEPREARTLFERLVHNLGLMLSQRRVHGDLSAYNILYWDGEITLIDFPQAINPLKNPNAYVIFQRDVTRICEYFIAQGLKIEPGKLAADLWQNYHYSTTPNILWSDDDDEE